MSRAFEHEMVSWFWPRTLLALLVCLAAPGAAHAQARRDPVRVWAAAGVGAAASASDDGLGALVQLAWQREPHQVTLRLVGLASVYSSTSVTELGVLYGRVFTGSVGHAAISAGLGAASRCSGGTSTCDRDRSISLPLSAEAAVRILPVAGLGAQVFGSINSIDSMGGVLIFLQLGWLPR